MKSNSTATTWLTHIAIIGLLHGAQAGILFSDTFDRADNTNLNAATGGKSGTLGALTCTKRGFGTSPTCEIQGQKLAMASNNSIGANQGIEIYHGATKVADFLGTVDGFDTISAQLMSIRPIRCGTAPRASFR